MSSKPNKLFIQSLNLKQQNRRTPSQHSIQLQESQHLLDVHESSIAQEQVFHSEIFRKRQSRKSSFRENESFSNRKQSQMMRSPVQKDFNNGNDLFGSSLNKKIQIVSMKQIKIYQDEAKQKKSINTQSNMRSNQKRLSQVNMTKNNQSSMKKSISSYKLSKQKQKQKQKQSQFLFSNKESNLSNPSDQKHDKKSLQLKSQQGVNIQPFRLSYDERYLSRNQDLNKFSKIKSPTSLVAYTVPFSFQNIRVGKDMIRQQYKSQNSHKSNKQKNNQTISNKQSINRTKPKLKQLSACKYHIEVNLNLNEFQYQLQMKVNLQKNRGFRIYLVNAQKDQQNESYEQLRYFKYEVIKLPPNYLRLRIYLLINKNNSKNQLFTNNYDNQQLSKSQPSSWKIWKQLQIPIVQKQNQQTQKPSSHHHNHHSNQPSNHQWLNHNNKSNNPIQISIKNYGNNYSIIKINDILDVNVKLTHSQLPLCYYCIEQDFNGVEIKNINLTGRQSLQPNEQFINDGCQQKCQII